MLPAVVPVLVGPLQTLIALAPALLVALGGLLFALCTPRGWRLVARFFWHQKLLSAALLLVAASLWTGQPWRSLGLAWSRLVRTSVPSESLNISGSTTIQSADDAWPMFRGAANRRALAWLEGEPRSPGFQWTHSADTTIFSSPCVIGDQLVFATADGIGPFSPAGRGAIVSLDLATGRERWRYAPDGFRATFCSPVAAERRIVCGEGLHLVQDARVTCLDLEGKRQWEFRTRSHVEATPCIAAGRVFVGAGDDGFYCLSLHDVVDGAPRVLWHLPGDQFPDCESPPLEHDGAVYFGLGLGGQAVCCVDAATGKLRWRTPTPHPAFAPPAIVPASGDRPAMLLAAIGRGNFVQSADELLAAKLDELGEENASPATLEAARRELGPAGELWWLDLVTGEVRKKFAAADTILGGAAVDERGITFGSRDGRVYRLDHTGEPRAQWDAREPIVTSLVVAREQLFVVARSGRLHALDRETLAPRWDMQLGDGENFFSSPVLARKRLYVGTPANGLRCVGFDTPPAPLVWNHGQHGGVADDRQLPEQAAIAWIEREPHVASTAAARHWCPTPTTSRMVVVRSDTRATHVAAFPFRPSVSVPSANATGEGANAAESNASHESFPVRSGAWRLTDSLMLPPAAVGDLVLLALDRQLAAIDTAAPLDRPRWQVSLGQSSPLAMAVDSRRILLVDATELTAYSLDSGTILYRVPHGLGDTLGTDPNAAPTNSVSATNMPPMVVYLADDLLIAARGARWNIFDAPTGRSLSSVGNPLGRASNPPLADPDSIAAPSIRYLWRSDTTATLVADHDAMHLELANNEITRQPLLDSPAGLPAKKRVDTLVFATRFAPPYQSDSNPASLLTLTTAGDLRCLDGTATAPRWEVNGLAAIPPLAVYPTLIATRDSALVRISAEEGQESEWFRWPAESLALAPATPLVAVQGRVYYSTEQGWLVCLAEAP